MERLSRCEDFNRPLFARSFADGFFTHVNLEVLFDGLALRLGQRLVTNLSRLSNLPNDVWSKLSYTIISIEFLQSVFSHI